jgi:hypothetical protein
MNELSKFIKSLIEECRNDNDIDRQVSFLTSANAMLPVPIYLKIPSLITTDYNRLSVT